MACCEISVSPNVFQMASQETLPITFDATSILLPGESIISATAQLVEVGSGQEYAAGCVGTVAVAGNDLTQTVTSLAPRKRYRLVIQFEVAVNKVWAPYLLIECPE